jgi:phenylpropionate dioxygenase-like ring-hydroxylating dioxygenase large terminal subunit
MPQDLRWAEKFPELGSDPIPIDGYVTQEQFEKERDRIFRRVWLMVGRAEELPARGDYKIKRLDFAKTSIILFRGRDNEVRAFHNICSHRGNKVLAETGNETFGRSPASTMFCKFHGWVYDGAGKLINVPGEAKFGGCFDKADHGLASVHVGLWEGFIFINLASEPAQTLQESMLQIGEHLGGYPFHDMPHTHHYSLELDCNWKVAIDAFSEAYHVGVLHGRTLPGSFTGALERVQLMGDHRTSANHIDLATSSFTPLQEVSNSLAGVSLMAEKSTTMLPSTVNPDRSNDFGFEMSPLFPNTIIHITDGIWFTHEFWPLSRNRTLWQAKYHLRAPATNSELWAADHAQIITRNVWLEDGGTMEATQSAIESGAKTAFVLHDDEILIRHNFKVIEKYVAA